MLAGWFGHIGALVSSKSGQTDRAPIAVLDLPGSPAEYLRGRSRQALRTNLKRAAASGITCAPVDSAEEVRRVADAIAHLEHQPTLSMGVAERAAKDSILTLPALLAAADAALYEAKKSNRDCIKIYSAPSQAA